MSLNGRTRACSVLLLILAMAALLALNWPALLGQRVPAGDGRGWFLPHFVLLSDHIRQGQLLSWDPWTAGGVPTFTEPQAGAYSPITLAFGLVSGGSLAGYNAYAFLMPLLGMVGMFLLARTLRAGNWGAMALGLAYAGNGVFIGQPHISHHVAMAFVPWILWRLEIHLRHGRRLPLLQAGALGGLAGLSAHPAALFYCGLFCGLYFAGRLVLRDSGRRQPMPVSRRAWLLPALMVAVAIIAPVYVLFKIEGTGVHARTNAVSREMAQAVSLDPRALTSAINPATPVAQLVDSSLWPGMESSLASVYSGILPVLLVGLCMAARPTRAWSWWLFACGMLFLAMAMGRHLPLHGAVYDAVAPLRLLRHASIFRLGWILAMAMLAIQGMRELRLLRRRTAGAGLRSALALLAIGVVALMVGRGYVAAILPRLPEARWAMAHLALWALAAALLAGQILLLRWHTRARAAQILVAAMLIAVALGDYALSYRLSSRLMFDVDLTYWSNLAAQHHSELSLASWYRAEGARGNASTATVTRQPAFIAHTTLKNGYLRQLAACPPLRQMVAGEQRVWFCPNPPRRPCSSESFVALVQASKSAGRPLMILHPPSSMLNPAPPAQFVLEDVHESPGVAPPATPVGAELPEMGAAVPLDARLLDYRPERLALQVRCPTEGWLMVTDRWSSGWRAQVNGVGVDVWGADTLFRAVPVRGGDNTVVFIYRPALRYPLLALSWATLGGMALASLWPSRRISRRQSPVAKQQECPTAGGMSLP